MNVYVDTSAILAVLNPNDRFHAQAQETWRDLLEIADRLVCSNYILVETLALAQRRMGLSAVHALVNDVLPVFQVVWVQEPDHQAGLRILLASGQRKLSLVDCVSFAILRRLGIGRVFCFDEDFAEQGFKCLPE